VPDDVAGLRAANARLRAVVEAKDAEIAGLRLELDAARERERRVDPAAGGAGAPAGDGQLELRDAELEGADRG
jgi:hypothetical protein